MFSLTDLQIQIAAIDACRGGIGGQSQLLGRVGAVAVGHDQIAVGRAGGIGQLDAVAGLIHRGLDADAGVVDVVDHVLQRLGTGQVDRGRGAAAVGQVERAQLPQSLTAVQIAQQAAVQSGQQRSAGDDAADGGRVEAQIDGGLRVVQVADREGSAVGGRQIGQLNGLAVRRKCWPRVCPERRHSGYSERLGASNRRRRVEGSTMAPPDVTAVSAVLTRPVPLEPVAF